VARGGDDLRFFNAVVSLLNAAEEKKAKLEECAVGREGDQERRGVGRAGSVTRPYVAQALVAQDGHADLAVNYARRAERLLDARDTPGTRFNVLNVSPQLC
jgi:hypothetical protein